MPYRTLVRRVGDAVRLADVIQVLVRHGFADMIRRMGLYEGLPAKVLRRLHLIEQAGDRRETRGTRLRSALIELGPTFVKFGQILSTRPDLVGKEICDDLSELQDRVTAVPFEKIKPVIVEALGEDPESLFEEFGTQPVAAASLSQVYKATLRDGRDVAVKVQRPGIRRVIESDLSLMRGIAEWVSEHVHDLDWMDPVGTVDEFERSILRELDFTVEARIIERFRENFKDDEGVFIPQIYGDLSDRTVLTMDWIDGVRLDAVDQFEERHCDAKLVAARGSDTLCRQIFVHNLFHADPHPGNIFVMRHNRIAFLDYGMVGHLERTDALAIADLIRSILRQDASACVQALLSFTSSAAEVDNPEALEHEVADYVAFEAQALVSGGEVGKAVDQITTILRRHKLQLAPRFSLLLKALATVESTGKTLDPELDIVPIIQPYVERIVTERFSPASLLQEGHQNLIALLRMGRDIPNDVRQLLRLLRRGRLKVVMTHEGLDNIANVTDRASNRIAFAVIAGSLIIGSSLLMFQDIGGRHIGLAGFIGAGVLGLALLVSILRSRNF